MLLPLASAGAVLTDPYLALGVTLSMTSFLLARRDGPRGAMASSWVWRSACCPRAVGPGAGGGRRAALVAAARRTRAVARAAWIGGTILMLALALPWYVMAEIRTPGFLQYFIVGEHFLRFVDPGWQGDLYGTAHKRPYGGIWLDWLLATMPWGLAGLWLFLRPGQDAPLRTRLARDRCAPTAAALGPGRARVLHAVRQYPLDLRAAFATAAGAGAGRLDGGPCADAGLARPVAGGADAADPARGADAGRAVARAARTLQDRKAAGGPGLRAHAARRAAGLRGQQAVLGALLFAGRGRSQLPMRWRRRRPAGAGARLFLAVERTACRLARHAGRPAAAALRQPALRAAASRKRRRRGAR